MQAGRVYERLFQHWRDYHLPGCHRAKRWCGETLSCFRRWWRALTEEERDEGRALLRQIIEAAAMRAAGRLTGL